MTTRPAVVRFEEFQTKTGGRLDALDITPEALRARVSRGLRALRHSLAKDPIPARSEVLPRSREPGLDVHEQRMPPGNQQGGEWRDRIAMLECRREEVPLHVMHGDERTAARERE